MRIIGSSQGKLLNELFPCETTKRWHITNSSIKQPMII